MNMPALLVLTGKSAIVTRGGNGIGNACGLRLGEDVASVVADPNPHAAQVVGIERHPGCMRKRRPSRFVCGGGTR